MPWILDKKPFLIIEIFGYIDYAHKILHLIKHLSRKYLKIVL